MPSKNFWRFCIVGLINTLIDIALFTLLRGAHVPIIIANICSTSVALAVSLVLNYHYTFRSNGRMSAGRIGLYIVVTLVGLWLLQPIVITSALHIDKVIGLTAIITRQYHHELVVTSTFAKLCATTVTLIWNYVWYSRVVFRKDKLQAV